MNIKLPIRIILSILIQLFILSSFTANIYGADTTPPAILLVFDDGNWTSSTTQLHAYWFSVDNESGIAEYKYAIGTNYDTGDVVDWTSVGTSTQVTVPNLSLSQNQTYYFTIEAINGAGLSIKDCSNGITVDATYPPVFLVFDDGDWTSTNTQLHASWFSVDNESGIAEYKYAIGTTPGGTDVVDWKSAGISTEVTETGLNLTNGTKYYWTIEVINGAGLSDRDCSNGITVDTTYPSLLLVFDDGDWTSSTTELHANWYSVDNESGIAEYKYAIGTNYDTGDIVDWTSVGTSTEITATDLNLAHAQKYYFTIEAINGAGLSIKDCSNGIKIDITSSVAPIVTDDGDYTTSLTELHATWSSQDPESEVSEYQYSIGTSIGATDVIGWTSTGTDTEGTQTNLFLEHGQTYYFNVKARNGVGLWSEIGSSNGIIVDANVPVITSITPENDSTFFTKTEVVINVTAQDEDGDSLEYQFLVDDKIEQDWSTSSTFEWIALPTTKLIRKITCRVRDDKGGEIFQDVCYNIEIDTSDATPPSTPTVTTGEYSYSLTQLSASWVSEDQESGIVKFQYAIGTTQGGTDVVDWTSAGTSTEVTHTGLSLNEEQDYFFSIASTNGVGIKSIAGKSLATNASKEVIIKITSPQDNAIITENEVTITGIAEGVKTVQVNGRPVDVDINGNFNGPILIPPGYAARKGITGSNRDYIIMSFPGPTTITVEAKRKSKEIKVYYYQMFVKTENYSYEGDEGDDYPETDIIHGQLWNNNALVQCPFLEWSEEKLDCGTRVRNKSGGYPYEWLYYKDFSSVFFDYKFNLPSSDGIFTATTQMTIHTLPAINGKIQPMVLVFKNCYFYSWAIKYYWLTFDLSQYKVNGKSLKMLYGEWDSYEYPDGIPNACYVILDNYEPDKDIEMQVEIPTYEFTLGDTYIYSFRHFSMELDILRVDITTPTDTDMNITNDPAMPDITFHADIGSEEILANTTFHWYLTMTFKHDTLGTLTHRVPTSGTDDIKGNGDWTPDWNAADVFAGGDVKVYVNAVVSFPSSASVVLEDDQDGYKIKGTNPTQAQIFGIADDVREQAICWKESTHRQFNAKCYTGIAMPLPCYEHDGGYGLMMLTSKECPPSEAKTWNWKTNLTAGVAHLTKAYNQSVQHVKNCNDPDPKAFPVLKPLPDPPLSLTTEQHWMNAFSLYRKGKYYYKANPVSGSLYEWVRLSGTGPDYADEIKKIMEDKPWE